MFLQHLGYGEVARIVFALRYPVLILLPVTLFVGLLVIGGVMNAYTTDDVTVYWETVPANYLERVLWLDPALVPARPASGDCNGQRRVRDPAEAADERVSLLLRPTHARGSVLA